MATREFENIPGAAKPGQATDLGKRNQDIDKYLADQIESPEIADAAKQHIHNKLYNKTNYYKVQHKLLQQL
tara:strand:+ start:196 stop:408 length:213 start_codon:yes stop_codon:yes gene_type:complete